MKHILIIFFLALMLNAQDKIKLTGLPDKAPNLADFYGEAKTVYLKIVEQQEKYYDKHKRYFQGLPGTEAKEISTATLARFNRSVKPGDQKEDWLEFGLPDISTRGKYWVDVYDGPKGKGFVVRASIIIDGNEYQMAINHGPEAWMGSGLVFVKREIADLGIEASK